MTVSNQLNRLTMLLKLRISSEISKGGFWLTKWLCNRPEVLNSIPQVERAPSVLALDLDKGKRPIQGTLVLHWDIKSDKFMFKVALKDKQNTRRGILSLMSSVYNPLEFVAPLSYWPRNCCKISVNRSLDGTIQSAMLIAKGGRSRIVSFPVSLRLQ